MRLWFVLREVIVSLGLGFVFFWVMISTYGHPTLKYSTQLLFALSQAQYALVDASEVGGLPADIGAKSNFEYVTYLVKKGFLEERDLRWFCKHEARRESLKDLRPEDLNVKFANVSRYDPPETVFFATANYTRDSKPAWKWRIGTTPPYKDGFSVVLLNTNGKRFEKASVESSQFGALPPREPAFLGD